MPESVSLGVVYTSAELRLTDFNKQWDTLVGKLGEIGKTWDKIKFSSKNLLAGMGEAEKGVSGLNKAISGTLSQVEKLNKLAFNASGILRGTDQAARALEAVGTVSKEASRLVLDLSAKTTEAAGSLRGMGTAAAEADSKLDALAGATTAAAAAAQDLGKAGLDTGAGLETLADGASTAKGSVSALGRAAGLAAPKLESLSLAKFDPAGIVAGADEGIGALGRLRLAAQGVKDSLRMSPVLTGAGGRASGSRRSVLAPLGGAAASGAANVAAGATVIAGVDLKNYVEYSGQAQQIAGNTNMTAADSQRMYQSGLKAMRLGADGQQAMRSYMHIANHDFSGGEADTIQDYATKINVGTGADMEQSGQVLSAFLHQAKLKATPFNVSRAANLQHQATASGDLNMEQYNKYGAPAVGKAFSLGNSPVDSLAFLTAMTKQNMRIPQAATNLGGLTWQITHPTAKAQKAIDKAGIGGYFGPEALHKYGAYGILQHTNDVLGGNKARLMDIFANKQGGFAAVLATGPGKKDYHNQLTNPKNGNRAAWEGKIHPVEERAAQMQKTPQQQVKRLQGEMKADSIEIGKSFVPLLASAVPVLKMFADQVQKVVGFLGKLPLPVQEAVVGLGLMKLATVALGNPLVGLGEGVGSLITKLGGLEEGAGALEGLGAAAGPIGLVVAAVVAFGIAWKTNFGNIRGAFKPFLDDVKQTFGGSGKAIGDFIKTTLPDLKKFIAEVEPLFAVHFKILGTVVKVAFDVIKAVVKAALAVIGGVFRTALALLTGDWKGAFEGLGSIFRGQWAAILGLANDIAPKFVAWISHLGTDIKNGWIAALSSLKAEFAHGGKDLVDSFGAGLKNGIASVGPGLKAAAESLASLIPTGVRSVLQIHSPSRVMHTIGQQTAEGLANGITAGKSGVTAAMRDVVKAALAEINTKRANLLIDHQARALRAGGMNASDVADFRESAKVALSEHGKSGRGKSKLDSERHAAGEFAATVGESPELKELHRLNEARAKGLISAAAYAQALGRIQGNQNKKAEAATARHQAVITKYRKAAQAAGENLQQIKDRLAAFTDSPETRSLDKQEVAAKRQYRDNIQKQGGTLVGNHLAYGPYRPEQSAAFALAAQMRDKQLAEIQSRRDGATANVQSGIDGMNDKAAQDKHPYDFQRDQAKKKYGTGGTEIKAGADPVKTAEALRLALAAIDTEETKDAKETEDRKQQYLLSTQAITLTQYQTYLKTRLGDYQGYSSEWVQLSQSINDIDLQLWKQQEDALKQKFDAGLIDFKDYISEMKALEATLPKTASPDEKAGIDDQIAKLSGKENKQDDKEMVGGGDFWESVTSDAADNGSHVLTALLHPKDKKKIMSSMWSDLMGSLEGAVTGQFSKLLKNLITGGVGGGFSLGNLFGGLFGGGKKSQAAGASASDPQSALAVGGGMMGTGLSALASLVPGMGGLPIGNLLNSALPGLQGINGPVGSLTGGGAGGPLGGLTNLLPMLGHGGLLGGILGHGGLAGLLGHGAMSALPWVGGGLLLNSALGNPLGKVFKGLKKLFHFAKGTWSVPGAGSHDSVPSMLTPGEMVLPKASAQLVREALTGRGDHPAAGMDMRGGDTHIHVTHNGDINNHEDGENFHREVAMQIKQQLPVTTPGT